MKLHHEVELPSFLSPFILSSINFESKIVTAVSGKDYIHGNLAYPTRLYKIISARLSRSQLEYFSSFFIARKGGLYSFRYHDSGDYKVDKQLIPNEKLGSKFTLYKLYHDGTYHYHRNSICVRNSTLEFRSNLGVRDFEFYPQENNYSILGTIGDEETIEVSFEFDIKLRFVTDKLEYEIMPDGSFKINEIVMKEVVRD